MPIRFSLFAGLAALTLAACAGQDDAPADDAGAQTDVAAETGDTDEDRCGAADYRPLVGSSIAAVSLPSDLNHRIIGPDTAVTMDYNPERLNIYTDEDGVVTEVKCG